MTKTRDAIVADFAGLTRDRHYGDGRIGEHEFIVIDTGGFEPDGTDRHRASEMAKQTRQAVAEADAVMFVVDVRAGVVGAGPRHRALPAHARASRVRAGGQQGRGHDRVAAARRVLRARPGRAASDLGGARRRASAAWSTRRSEPLDAGPEDEDEPRPTDAPIRLAVAGRPNVGKSTLINTWLGEERLVAFDQPGTTRDAITRAVRARRPEVRADRHRRPAPQAARCSRRSRSSRWSRRCRRSTDANVVLLLLDATQGVTDQDAHIAGYILESGRAVVVAVNKWDAVDAYQQRDAAALDRAAAGLPASSRRCCTSRRSSARASAPVWKAIARRPRVGDAQDADAGADAAAAGGGASTRRRSAPARSARSCATRTRAA